MYILYMYIYILYICPLYVCRHQYTYIYTYIYVYKCIYDSMWPLGNHGVPRVLWGPLELQGCLWGSPGGSRDEDFLSLAIQKTCHHLHHASIHVGLEVLPCFVRYIVAVVETIALVRIRGRGHVARCSAPVGQVFLASACTHRLLRPTWRASFACSAQGKGRATHPRCMLRVLGNARQLLATRSCEEKLALSEQNNT